MHFCEQSTREAQLELELHRNVGIRTNRTGRQIYESAEEGIPQPSLGTGIPMQTECPGCCIPGPPGPRGPSGQPGKKIGRKSE